MRRRCRFTIWLYHYKCLTKQFQSPKFCVAVAIFLFSCLMFVINIHVQKFLSPKICVAIRVYI